ncbi:TrmB family transcriptional regulator [Streptomyces microflavus]|uniref:TrmB family transcriptional regulator n=1 Tax=Streptomyces microflavus TaxID=1919 RepID=UPI00366814CB
MSDVTHSHLGSLGLSARAARLYSRLLGTGPLTPAQLADRLDEPEETLAAALSELAAVALIAPLGHEGDPVVPLDPAAGLQLLASRRKADLNAGTTAVAAAYEAYRRAHSLTPGAPTVEVLEQASLQRKVVELERSAVSQVRSFDTAPYGAATIANPVEIANLGRGVSYRVLYAQSSVETPDYFQGNIVPCTAAGEEARMAPSVPAKMMLVDDRFALVSLSSVHADTHHGALLVHPCSLLPALSALFESAWQSARPLAAREGENTTVLRPLERRLLALLAAGVADEAAARNLGISKRTLARAVERLMSLAGVSSRFQLGVHAKSEGWL